MNWWQDIQKAINIFCTIFSSTEIIQFICKTLWDVQIAAWFWKASHGAHLDVLHITRLSFFSHPWHFLYYNLYITWLLLVQGNCGQYYSIKYPTCWPFCNSTTHYAIFFSSDYFIPYWNCQVLIDNTKQAVTKLCLL